MPRADRAPLGTSADRQRLCTTTAQALSLERSHPPAPQRPPGAISAHTQPTGTSLTSSRRRCDAGATPVRRQVWRYLSISRLRHTSLHPRGRGTAGTSAPGIALPRGLAPPARHHLTLGPIVHLPRPPPPPAATTRQHRSLPRPPPPPPGLSTRRTPNSQHANSQHEASPTAPRARAQPRPSPAHGPAPNASIRRTRAQPRIAPAHGLPSAPVSSCPRHRRHLPAHETSPVPGVSPRPHRHRRAWPPLDISRPAADHTPSQALPTQASPRRTLPPPSRQELQRKSRLGFG